MKQIWKKAASGLLALTLVTGSLPANIAVQDLFSGAVLTAYAEDAPTSGTCGENLTWALEQNNEDAENPTYTLTISGTGAMEDYRVTSSTRSYPWSSYYTKISAVVIEKGATQIGTYAFKDFSILTSVTIPNSVTEIGYYAFSACTSLTSVTIPNGVLNLERGVFKDCFGLTSVALPSYLASIQDQAFSNCSHLVDVILPSNLRSIGSSAFYQCKKLTSVTIPDSVTYIDESAFKGCIGLNSVVIMGDSTAIGVTVFDITPDTMQIYVPAAKQEDYKNAENWSNYADKIIGFTDTKLPDGKYKQTAERNGTYYTRFVFVVPKTDFAGKSKAKFTATYQDTPYTFETNTYYTGVISNGVTYNPASSGDRAMFVVTVSSGSDISADLTCKLDFE